MSSSTDSESPICIELALEMSSFSGKDLLGICKNCGDLEGSLVERARSRSGDSIVFWPKSTSFILFLHLGLLLRIK